MTKVYIYCQKDERGNPIFIPFLKYLKGKYYDKNGELMRRYFKDVKNFKAVIACVANGEGRYNQPPLSEHYRGRRVGVMKIKEGEVLVRIAFWARVGEKMVLLKAVDKPHNYEKAKKKKVNKMIAKWLDESEELLDDLLEHPKNITPFNL